MHQGQGGQRHQSSPVEQARLGNFMPAIHTASDEAEPGVRVTLALLPFFRSSPSTSHPGYAPAHLGGAQDRVYTGLEA